MRRPRTIAIISSNNYDITLEQDEQPVTQQKSSPGVGFCHAGRLSSVCDWLHQGSAALALHQARTIQIYGVAASAITGDYLHYRLLRLGKSAMLFNDMHRVAMNASAVREGDLVIAISSSGSTIDLMHVVKLAKKQKARVLMLSNTLSSPIGKLAYMLLVAARPEGPLTAGSLSTKVGAMLLVEVLTLELTALGNQYASQPTDCQRNVF